MPADTIISLTVRNHPGVMSHVTGLFARRAYNLEGIVCGPQNGGDKSRMHLLVRTDKRLNLVIRNIEKLYDVLDVSLRPDRDGTLFSKLDELDAEG